jgi:dUTPase
MSSAADTVRVRIRRLDHATDLPLPEYASAGAAGMDVRAAVATAVDIEPGAIARVPTGPRGRGARGIRDPAASALGARDEARRHAAEQSGDDRFGLPRRADRGAHQPRRRAVPIERGMRIAQLLLARVPRIEWDEADTLTPTTRGAGGFGHTGVD